MEIAQQLGAEGSWEDLGDPTPLGTGQSIALGSKFCQGSHIGRAEGIKRGGWRMESAAGWWLGSTLREEPISLCLHNEPCGL